MPHRKGDWLQTYTGRIFWPLDPRPEEVSIEDIAHALSLQCRFGGHPRTFYSVGEHSVRVSNEVPPSAALWGLLHDASEAYLVDLPSPIKHCDGFGKIYRQVEKHLQAIICQRFGISRTEPESVRGVDLRMLITEQRDLLSQPPKPWAINVPPFQRQVVPVSSAAAERMFLARYCELTGVPIATDSMSADQEAHLERVKRRVCERIDQKYRRGQKEHGGDLWRKNGIIEMLLDEVADSVVYGETLKEQNENSIAND